MKVERDLRARWQKKCGSLPPSKSLRLRRSISPDGRFIHHREHRERGGILFLCGLSELCGKFLMLHPEHLRNLRLEMSRLMQLFPFRQWRELRALRKKKQFGMTSPGEQHWLRTYAARRYRGEGAIVDLGCFLGATTIALAQGLALNTKAKRKRIDAYDLFVWGEGFEAWAKGREMEGVLTAGGSFLPEFVKRTREWRDHIVVHQEDLSRTRWENGPIEFLFVDAMKNPATATAIASAFFPHLIVGRSYLAHQDFPHANTPWIHFLAYRLRHHFRWVEEMPQSSLFRLDKKIEPELLAPSLEPGALSSDEIEAAFDYSLSFVSDDKKANVIAAKAMAYVGRGEFGRAHEIMIHSPYGPASRADEFRSVKALVERKQGLSTKN